MADTFSLSAIASCAAGAGVVDVSSTFAVGTSPHEDSTNFTCYLLRAGAFVDSQPLAKNGACQFTGVADGHFDLEWRGDESANVVATTTVDVDCTSAGVLVLDPLVHTNETAARNNGTVTARATGGTNPLTITVLGTAKSQVTAGGVAVTLTGLAPATYAVRVTDAAGRQASGSVTIAPYAPPAVPGCTDPAATNYDPNATVDNGSCTYTPPPRVPHFLVPLGQSLRFVHPDRADLPAFDNRLLAGNAPPDTTNPGYCQLVERGDTLVIQYQSNYTGPATVQLRPPAGGAVRSFTPTRVVQGTGISPLFDAYARPDTLPANTRIYFNHDALPVPLGPGSRVTLSNAGGLNGTYPVVDVREDPAAGVPYLLLTTPYPGGAQRIDLALTTPYALQVFDTWQVVMPFSAVPAGDWQAVITVTDADFGTTAAASEPIDVATSHRDTAVIVYRNFDNAFGLNYTHGLMNRLRVKARLFDRQTPTQKTTLRGSDNRLTLLTAEAQRKIPFVVYLAPGWLQEVIALAFCHDFVRVSGVEVIAEGEYEYPAVSHYSLTTGRVVLEQVDFLQGNRDDVGDVDSGTLLLANDLFLTVNP